MTKTEYREYIASEEWRSRRRNFLETCGNYCKRCWIPRWLAVVAYDQDLNVHHKSYARLGGEELDEDLEPLCRRCHDIETFGTSELHQPQCAQCTYCTRGTYRLWPYPVCDFCAVMREYIPEGHFEINELRAKLYPGSSSEIEIWKSLFFSIVQAVSWCKPDMFSIACDCILWALADEEKRRAERVTRVTKPPGREIFL
jgi:hypothetical protein